MEVILREDVKSLGKAGDLVRVKAGYGRNYLLPQGLAFEANEGNKKRIEAEAKSRQARLAHEKSGAETMAATLRTVELAFSRKAGEGEKLFGSITAQDVAAALEAKGHPVDRRKIDLEHPIKTLGAHTVLIRLHPEVHAEVRVTVTAAE